jgi:outer membrane protein TolC
VFLNRDRVISTSRFAAVALAAAALSSIPARAQDTLQVLTLEQAVRMSLSADPRVVAAESGISSAQATLQQARGAFLPSLNVSSTYGNSSNERLDPASGNRVSESYTANTQLGYEIFSGGRRGAERRSARAQVDAATAGLTSERYTAVLATTEAFYAAAAAEEVLAASGARLQRAQQQQSFAQTRLDVGTATRSDVLRAELEVGNARVAVIDAETAVRTSRLQLGRRVGVGTAVRPAPTALPTAAPALPAPERLAVLAVERSPEVLAAEADLRASQAATRASYSTYVPSLRATAGYDWFSFEFPPSDRSWSLRLTASLPVFNGFQREATVTRARAAQRTAEAAARDAAVTARAEAATAAEEVRAAGERAAIMARAVELAREDLAVQQERYQLGATTILELQASQVTLADAEVAAVRARQALATALARLEAVLGVPLSDVQ